MKWLVIGLIGIAAYWGINAASGAAMQEFDPASLNVALRNKDKVVVVEYFAATSDCKDLSDKFEKVANRYTSEAIIGKLDINKHTSFAETKLDGVRGSPYTQVFVKGKMVEDFIGSRPENELRAMILRHQF